MNLVLLSLKWLTHLKVGSSFSEQNLSFSTACKAAIASATRSAASRFSISFVIRVDTDMNRYVRQGNGPWREVAVVDVRHYGTPVWLTSIRGLAQAKSLSSSKPCSLVESWERGVHMAKALDS